MRVLFTSSRPLERAENLRAVWDAFGGDKDFAQIDPNGNCPEAEGSEERGFSAVVTDEFLKTIRGKDRVKVVMVEHGLAGGKKYGLDQRVRYYTPEQTAQIDYFVTSGEAGRAIAASCAGIPVERCLPLGMPRTDAYFDKEKGDGGTFLAHYEHAYLYAPTLRAGWEPQAPAIDWALVDGLLGDGEMLAVKRHMVTGRPILDGRYEHVVEVSPDEPSTPYLVDCDVVMTDYSSIMLDGYVLGKPCLLYCPDRAEYLEARGMYRKYPDGYSSHWLAGFDEMIPAMLRRAQSDGLGFEEEECLEAAAGACDGHSAERVCGLIADILEGRR